MFPYSKSAFSANRMPRGGGLCCSGREMHPAAFVDERAEVRYAKSLAFAWLMTDNAAFAERAFGR